MPYKVRFTKAIFCIFLGSLSLISCKKNQPSQELQIAKTGIYESKEFLDFYNQFSTDSLYQLEHIVFPLEGMLSLQDGSQRQDPNFRWTKENWKIHKPYDDMEGTYSREFLDLAGIVIEKISDTSGQYTMERRFSKLSTGWHLIYYREMGRY